MPHDILAKSIYTTAMKYIFFLVFFIETVIATAADIPHSPSHDNTINATSCSNIDDIRQFVACVLEQHIEIIDLKSREQVAALKQGAASFRPNPKIDLQGGAGENVGDQLTQFQMKGTLPIELGGKRLSRMSLADAEFNQSKIERAYGTLEVLVDVYSRILKTHELYAHEKSYKESLQFVDRIYKLYLSRTHLDPEQTVSKHVFEMVRQKYTFDLILISREMESELNELVLMTQNKISKDVLKNIIINLPEPQWPDLNLTSENSGSSLWIQKIKAEAIVKEKKYDFEVSQSYPDFEMGPYYTQEYQGPLLTEYYGLALSFPVPIFNINSGGRALAKAEMESAVTHSKLLENKEAMEKKFLIESYQTMVQELKKVGPLLKNFTKANPTKGLFERGLIPATLAIESQRTHQELIMTAHELEIKTLEILFKIRSIEGSIDSDKLTLWPRAENK